LTICLYLLTSRSGSNNTTLNSRYDPEPSPVRSDAPNKCHYADWRPEDPDILLRFLVYSYTLSKYKRFFVGQSGGGCRLHIESVAEQTQRLIQPFWDLESKAYTIAKKSRIQGELTSLQIWLSELSCSWLQLLSQRLSAQSLFSRYLIPHVSSLRVPKLT